jgi:hypothetical protein
MKQELVMRFVQRWFVVLVAAVALSGCIKVDQTLEINPDGSGILDLEYGMSEQTIAQLEAMEQMAAGMKQQGMQVESSSPFDFDEATVRKKFAEEKPEGVELKDVSSDARDGWRYMRMKLTFDDLSSLKKTDYFKESGLSISKNAEGNYVLVQKLGSDEMEMPGGDAGGEEAMEEKMMQAMTAMFAGLHIELNVVVPGRVIESNATRTEGNRASWVYDIDQDPQVLNRLGGKEEMRLVFSGDGLDL